MRIPSWEPLKIGDIVEVIAPASKPRSGTLDGVARFLDSWGLQARLHKDTVEKDFLFANSKEKRSNFLKQAVLAKDSKMIWCLRGGYGSLQLLDDLGKLRPQQNKCFLGFSDITSLHSFLVQEWGWATIHGPNVDRFALGKGSAAEAKRIKNLIFGKTEECSFKLQPLNSAALGKKVLSSKIVGGNLITLQSGFGTKYQLETRKKILFLEDIGERAYKLDRVFEHMRQLNMYKGLQAIVFGQFTEGSEPSGKNLVPGYLKRFAEQQKFPVLSGLPSGHGNNQHPLPFGTKAKLELGRQPRLTVSTGAKLR